MPVGAAERGWAADRLDRRPARRQLARAEHRPPDRPCGSRLGATRLSLTRARLQPRARRRWRGGARRDLPDARRHRSTGPAARRCARRLAAACADARYQWIEHRRSIGARDRSLLASEPPERSARHRPDPARRQPASCCPRSPTSPSSWCTSTRRSTPARCRRAGRWRRHATPTASARASRAGATPRGCSPSPATATTSRTTWQFLAPRLEQAHRLLAREGTLYFHIDYREAHHCKLLLDEIFGRECFLNEIIWAYDYGARTKRRWPAKHDTILVYVKDPTAYYFDSEEVDREPYMAPGLVTPEKAARGKLPDGRVVAHDRAHQRAREDRLPDPEARGDRPSHGPSPRRVRATGVWTSSPAAARSGAVAAQLGRHYVLIDSNPEAVEIMRARLARQGRRSAGTAYGGRLDRRT